MSIKFLPDSVRTKLRSGVAITSVGQCVEELVLNSIDADATCIAIRIDTSSYKIQVVDNGHGITYGGLKLIGERYATSKGIRSDFSEAPKYHGYRGEAIASIRHISGVVVVESRSTNEGETYRKYFTHGVIRKIVRSSESRPSRGTTITILDFLYNLPIRRKVTDEILELENVRERIEAIAVIHPSISFTLRNEITGKVWIKTEKHDRIDEYESTFASLFGRSKARLMKTVSHEVTDFKLSGLVGTDGHANKNLQFLYVNKNFVRKSKIHRFINNSCLKTSIGRSSKAGNYSSNELTKFQSRVQSSPSRSYDRWCMFVLNIECNRDKYDISFEPRKSVVEFNDWNLILSHIDSLFRKFFLENDLFIASDVAPSVPQKSALVPECIDEAICDDDPSNFSKSHEFTQLKVRVESTNDCDCIDAQDIKNSLWSLPVKRPWNRDQLSHSNVSSVSQERSRADENELSKLFVASESGNVLSDPETESVSPLFPIKSPIVHSRAKRTNSSMESLAMKTKRTKMLKKLNKFSFKPRKQTSAVSICEIGICDGNESRKELWNCRSDSVATNRNINDGDKTYEKTAANSNPCVNVSRKSDLLTENSKTLDGWPYKSVCGSDDRSSGHKMIGVNVGIFKAPIFGHPDREYSSPSMLSDFHADFVSTFGCEANFEVLNFNSNESSDATESHVKILFDEKIPEEVDPANDSRFTLPRNVIRDVEVQENRHHTVICQKDISKDASLGENSLHSEPADEQRQINNSEPVESTDLGIDALENKADDDSIPIRSSCIGNEGNARLQTETVALTSSNEATLKHGRCSEIEDDDSNDVIIIDKDAENSIIRSDDNEHLKDPWISCTDQLGNVVYFNKFNGNSSSKVPMSATCEGKDDEDVRDEQLPYAPRQKQDRIRHACQIKSDELTKLINDEREQLTGVYSSVDTDLIFNANNNFGLNTEKEVITVDGKSDKPLVTKTNQGLYPYKFTKNMFEFLKVLGQIDRKFILCSVKSSDLLASRTETKNDLQPNQLLILFDQHAVHERIRIEAIMKDAVFMSGAGVETLKSVNLDEPLHISLPSDCIRLLKKFNLQFLKHGLNIQLIDGNVRVSSVPKCVIEREMRETKHNRPSILRDYIYGILTEEVQSLSDTRGSKCTLPRTVMEIMNSQACRGAIKFGDALTLDECCKILKLLSMCDLPFQCAHGRPSFVPLLDLRNVQYCCRNKNKKPNLNKLKTKMQLS
ncbi:MLH3 (predicted) [Pycnogonum litorale]